MQFKIYDNINEIHILCIKSFYGIHLIITLFSYFNAKLFYFVTIIPKRILFLSYQAAREELTAQALRLVTSSKLLVIAMSDSALTGLPEHLAASLTALRSITELTQLLCVHTSSPLQTRNIVLKVHDVASGFRELAAVKVGPISSSTSISSDSDRGGQLALRAECLADVLAALLRSLRVFSP